MVLIFVEIVKQLKMSLLAIADVDTKENGQISKPSVPRGVMGAGGAWCGRERRE